MNIEEILKNHDLWLKDNNNGCKANLSGADLSGAEIDYQIEEKILEKIAEIVLNDEKSLEMEKWHTCDTTHCIAGWACFLGKNGKKLEEKNGTQIAALLLLGAEAHRHFFDSNDDAILWLKTI